MDLAYIFLILLSFINQLPPSQLFGRFLLLNHQTKYCTINILPRDFPNSDLYQHLQNLHNNPTQAKTLSEKNELDGKPKVEVLYTETAVEETEVWYPELYPHIPACNKEEKCTAVILIFSPEQIQRDNGSVYEYIHHKELAQSRAISHVEEAIIANGDKLLIATSDEETVLKEFYAKFAGNKSQILAVVCGLGVLFGLVLSFFGRRILNPILFVVGFGCAALLVNFWVYPARLSEYYTHSISSGLLLNLALVLGSGLSAGIVAVKAQKVGVCLFFVLIGAGLSVYVWFLGLANIGFLFWIIFFLLVVGALYKLIRLVLKNYQEAVAFATALSGAICVPASIYLFFALDVTEQGFALKELPTRNRILLFWLGVFLVVYGTKFQLGIKRKKRGVQTRGNVKPGTYQVLPNEKELRRVVETKRPASEQKYKNKPKNMKPKNKKNK